MFGIGAICAGHTSEPNVDLPEFPVVFTKSPGSINGPVGHVVLSGPTVDWEAELVVVIGRRARNVAAERGWATSPG